MSTTLADAAHFGDYNPTDFGWPHTVPDLVPLTFDGVSFGSCARDAHGVFMALLTELVPHIQDGLHAGSCGGYSTTDDLPDGSWSFHRYGIAIDINWNVNKMGVPNAATGKYAIPHKIASQIAHKYGCEYGGDWTNPKDWMHFEVHLSPQVARAVTATATTDTTEDDMADLTAAQLGQIAHAVWAFNNGGDTRAWALLNVGANPARFASALVAALPPAAKGGLTEADVETAVRKVLDDATIQTGE